MEQDHANDKQEEQTDNHADDTPILPDQPQSNHRQQVRDRADNDQNQELEHIRWAEKWMVRLTGALVVASLASLGTAILQWRSSENQGVDTHNLAVAAGKQSDAASDMATAAGDQVDAANNFSDSAEEINRGVTGAVDQLKAAASNAKASIDATKEAMRLDQRAWIGFNTFEINKFEPGVPLKASILLINTGRTPAGKVRAGIGELFYSASASHVELKAAIANGIRGVDIRPRPQPTISPQGGLPLHLNTINPFPQDTYDRIRNRTYNYFTLGRVEYLDVFGRPQWMTFCVEIFFPDFNEPATWSYCDTGNDMSYQQEDRQRPN